MALPDHIKQRLANHAAANKGRTNLMGLDRTLGGVALDWAQENPERCAEWKLNAAGALSYRYYAMSDPERVYLYSVKTRYDEPGKLKTRYALDVPWVRLSFAPDWLKEQFALRFPSRRIAFETYDGRQSAPVFPIGVVAEFLRFLWPPRQDGTPAADRDLEDRCRKYLTGYSEN